MPDISFQRIGSFYYTSVSHGQSSLLGKLDSGSPITLLNIVALSLFLGKSERDIQEFIKKNKTPTCEFKGYNGIPSTVYLCLIHNVFVDSILFEEFWAGISLDYPIGRDGKPITKCLIGTDILDCCEGTLGFGKSIDLQMVDKNCQREDMKKAFGCINTANNVLALDEIGAV